MILNDLLRKTREAQRTLVVWESWLYHWLARYQAGNLDRQELETALDELRRAGLEGWLKKANKVVESGRNFNYAFRQVPSRSFALH